MVSGILYGLGAATFQSISYLCSRLFVGRFQRSAIYLLSISHIIMAVMSIVLLYFIWPKRMPPLEEYILVLIGASFFYLAGQACLFMALQRSAASRASPLLGLKVFILALICVLFLDQSMNVFQWIAVLLSVAAAFLLNQSGGSMPWQSIAWVLGACLGYSFSDLNIRSLVDHFSYLGMAYGSTISVCLSYLVCGLAGGIALFFLRNLNRSMWTYAIPFSLSWFAAMILLFACFGSIGVVFGNIVQSSRGMISILLGTLVASAGFVKLEEKVGRSVFVRRLAAALLMAAAISLFYFSAS